MQKILSFLLFFLLMTACENTEKPENNYFKMLSHVKVRLQRISESGRVLGTFDLGYYLSGVKIELIHEGNVVETTYPKSDTLVDKFYILTKLEMYKMYQVKISLNDEMVHLSKTFELIELDNINYSEQYFYDLYGYVPEWFVPGSYYRDDIGLYSFNLYSDNEKLIVYPNPFLETSNVGFHIEEKEQTKIDIVDIKLNNIATLYNEVMQAGTYSFNFGENLEDGLYLIKLTKNDSVYYCPVLKGRKGAPSMP